MVYCLLLILFLIGLYAVAVKKDLARTVIGIVIMETAVSALLALGGERGEAGGLLGLAVVILAIALVARLHDSFGTLDVSKLKGLKG